MDFLAILSRFWAWLQSLAKSNKAFSGLLGVAALAIVAGVFVAVANLFHVPAKWIALGTFFVLAAWLVLNVLLQIPVIRASRLGNLAEIAAWVVVFTLLGAMLLTCSSFFLEWPRFPRNVFFAESVIPRETVAKQALDCEPRFGTDYLANFANLYSADEQREQEKFKALKYIAKGMLPKQETERSIVIRCPFHQNFETFDADIRCRSNVALEGVAFLLRNPEEAPLFDPVPLTLGSEVRQIKVINPNQGDELLIFLKAGNTADSTLITLESAQDPSWFNLSIRPKEE